MVIFLIGYLLLLYLLSTVVCWFVFYYCYFKEFYPLLLRDYKLQNIHKTILRHIFWEKMCVCMYVVLEDIIFAVQKK